jgi:IclR family transcriptional regulator, KDG regulon repressor
VLVHLGRLVKENVRIRDVAVPHMERISSQYGELVHLAILNDDREVVSLEATPSRFNLRSNIHLGGRADLHCTGVGKAILAFLDPEEIRRILKAKRKRYTSRTITGERGLLRELATIRARGYAVDNMEHEEGVRCIAAPIRDVDGKTVGAISISGPSARIGLDRVPELARSVKEVALRISRDLGFASQ